MKSDWQSIVALGIVAVTVVLLVRSAWRKRRHPERGCDCPNARPAIRVRGRHRRAKGA